MENKLDLIFRLIQNKFLDINIDKDEIELILDELKCEELICEENIRLYTNEIFNKWINEKFYDLYRNSEDVTVYLPYIDVNYDEGINILLACQKNDIIMLEKLLNLKPSIDLSDILASCMHKGNLNLVKMLMSYGADPSKIGPNTTAFFNHKHITLFLLEHDHAHDFFGENFTFYKNKFMSIIQ
ncbi:ankyrin repeat protein [Megavirus baoshan]|uniref:Ankyrin repeat protein n=1 Tax=Megavirus baoshan TaxID=2496520 RepID=A0A3S8UYD4_9VIRU|nr:ankyrin repeat protein [Megavirus baoshan]YP_010789307.1 ankyrin repeat protein [Megavirus baoshan]AZL89708.1 ankyrin repeat protein [Megavirus baoshan]UFX99706.1 ankyrin repeat protein [Megavirus baoshan]